MSRSSPRRGRKSPPRKAIMATMSRRTPTFGYEAHRRSVSGFLRHAIPSTWFSFFALFLPTFLFYFANFSDLQMPPEESESEDDEEEVDDMSDLVGDDSDDEPDAAEAQGRSKPKADSKPAKRKVVTVDDDDFAVIKRTRKESAKGSKGQGIQKAAGSAKAQKRSTSKHSRNARE